MNLRQLRSLHGILQQGSFAAAGDQLGLSHAAISVQMRQLEEELGIELFDRSRRPVVPTADGTRIGEIAGEVLDRLEQIHRVAQGTETTGSISIGFIPTCVHHLLPRVLDALRGEFPRLQVRVRSGLSGELAAAVIRRELDYALLTAPLVAMPELAITAVAAEPFFVIGPIDRSDLDNDVALLRAMPYIAFSRRTWVGQHIAALLQQRGIHVNVAIEIDSLEAIENLVASGFGVSIVPRRLHATLDQARLVQQPLGNPVEERKLALVRHTARPGSVLDTAVTRIFTGLPGSDAR